MGSRAQHYPTPGTVFQRMEERRESVEGVELTVETTNIWTTARPTGFQGEIRIRNVSGKDESWETIKTVYGQTEAEITLPEPESGSSRFFRIKAEQ